MDWEPITLKKNDDTFYPETIYDLEYDKKRNYKTLSTESRNLIIHKRLSRNLRQYDVDSICRFPVNTTKKIELARHVPTPKQLNTLKKLFHCALKYAK